MWNEAVGSHVFIKVKGNLNFEKHQHDQEKKRLQLTLDKEDGRRHTLGQLYFSFLETLASNLENVKEERGLDNLKDLILEIQGYKEATQELIAKHTSQANS